MIIYKNEKYACVKCIKGHRATLCEHHDRVLMKVNKRGRRPNSDNSASKENFVLFKEDKLDADTPVSIKAENVSQIVEGDTCQGQKEPLFFFKKQENGDELPKAKKVCCESKEKPTSLQNMELIQSTDVFLESSCTCKDDNCACENCMMHRLDRDLDSFISKHIKINDNPNNIADTGFLQSDWGKANSVRSNETSLKLNNAVIKNEYGSLNSNYNVFDQKSENSGTPDRLKELKLDEIMRKGYDNIISKVDNNTLLVVDGRKIIFDVWFPQFQLFLNQKITLTQLVNILALL
jgi:hypothetical protein